MTGQTTVRRFERQEGGRFAMTAIAGTAWVTGSGELMIAFEEGEPIGADVLYGIDLNEQPHGSNNDFRRELRAAAGEDVPF